MIKRFAIFTFLLFGIVYYLFFLKSNVKEEGSIRIKQAQPFSQIYDSLTQKNLVQNQYILDLFLVVYKMNSVPAGHYKIKKSMTSLDILRKLKYGQQDPIRFTLSSATFIEEVAEKAADKMLFSAEDFMSELNQLNRMNQYGYDSLSSLTLFIPNTYEFYWTTTPSKFIDKWAQEHAKFWNQDRLDKAKTIHLNPKQVYILASLVQKEFVKRKECSKIAGVLLNRLNQSMPLQVDATCKYATRDFGAKRVLNYHTQFNSPFNTYKTLGLPPGPICVPEISTIDAVLSPEKHNYLYYCADPSLNGFHIFSKTLAEHEAVAHSYHHRMNELKMK